ncbi:hypothetical protein [Streptomyces sp. NPDC015350]|uniref:hypothetical protein n=1 Tax=Streptomyces sp. NPDC015350 TaxID=3364955 RepID=UPI0036F55221
MTYDPWKTWSNALTLLEREEPYLQIGAIGTLGMLTKTDKEFAGPTVDVLKSALNEWESQEPGPPAGVKDAACSLIAALTADGRDAEQRPALWRRLSRRLSRKAT